MRTEKQRRNATTYLLNNIPMNEIRRLGVKAALN
jgi:hypothetical protein